MLEQGQWFTEVMDSAGIAFSLKINSKLHEEQTPYQHIAIYDTQTFGKLMVIDGCIMLSTRDNFIYHEMLTHPAMFTHRHPKNVVIIGGGDCGTLKEVLKHRCVMHAHLVEIDERVTRLAEIYFPELCSANHDSRAQLFFGDGIAWIGQQPDRSQDVIIVDSTDPVGPAQGLFSMQFYRECFRVLKDDGILALQSESPLIHMDIIKSVYRSMLYAGGKHLRTLCFPQCVYPSGWWSVTLASKQASLDYFRSQDERVRTFDTRYYNAEMHRFSGANPSFLTEVLQEVLKSAGNPNQRMR